MLFLRPAPPYQNMSESEISKNWVGLVSAWFQSFEICNLQSGPQGLAYFVILEIS